MADSTSDPKEKKKNSIQSNQNLNECIEMDTSEASTRAYENDSDFNEAFKNLLLSIKSISKKLNQYEPLKYDLLKELDSYLQHIKSNNFTGSSEFVEAALVIQNCIFIYQKRVDQYISIMTKLVEKFRAYRKNPNDDADIDNGDDKRKKKRGEKEVKLYSSFEPIKGHIFNRLKNYDCKIVNLSKKQPLRKIILNTNIKVHNKYRQLLPYICVGNGENIGKKYDFMLNYPLNRDLAVNEEFDCLTNEDENSKTPFNNGTVPVPTNLMDVDGTTCDDILLNTPDSVVFDHTFTDETYVANAMLPNRENILNASKIPLSIENDGWATVTNPKHDIYSDNPIIKSKVHKEKDSGLWLPTYTIGELRCQLLRLKSGMSVDPAFRQLVHDAQEAQKSEIAKKRIKRIDKEKQQYDFFDEEMDEKLKNGEIPGFKGFDSPIYDDEIDYNFDEREEPLEDNEDNRDNFETYQKNVIEMKKYEENQLKMINEELEMPKRVQAWHDKIRPVLEEEEKRTDFDIHQYGTDMLDCFQSIGEQKSFKDLVGGLKEEEVARYFLSTLMMANTYNLKINKSSDDCNNEITIELLKKERHHEELQVNIGNQVNRDSL